MGTGGLDFLIAYALLILCHSLFEIVIKVVCKNDEADHKPESYRLEKGSYSVSKLTKEGGTYKTELTVEAAAYVAKYNKTHGDHVLDDENSKTMSLVYNEQGQWEAEESAEITFNVFCETIEKAPEKPGYSELKELFGDEAVEVACATDSNAHETKTYGLARDSYTLGDVVGNSESGYQVSLTIKSESYVEQYSETYGAHIPYGSGQAVITLNYNQQTKKWEVEENLPIHFDAIDKPSDVRRD